MGRLEGKKALVLGASSEGNMGQVIARRFMAEGAQVLVSGRKGDVLEAFAKETGAKWTTCDLTDEASVNALADNAVEQMGGIDIALHAIYMGTKAGTDHIIRCIAHEFGSEGIRANSISPGLTDTPMTAEAGQVPGLFEAFRAGYPLGRWGTSDDIAAAAVFLASDECFMTGENLQVNGGLTLRRNPTREEIGAAVAKATGRG